MPYLPVLATMSLLQSVMCTHHQRNHDEGGGEPAGEPLLLFGRSAIGAGRRPRGCKQREALDRRTRGAIHAIEARVGTQLDLPWECSRSGEKVRLVVDMVSRRHPECHIGSSVVYEPSVARTRPVNKVYM